MGRCVTNLSLVTLHKGRERQLANLLQGLRNANFGGDLVIAEMGAVTRLPPQPFSVTQIAINAGDLPLASARNAGRKAAKNANLVFLDIDCVPAPDMIAVLSDVLAQRDAFVCAQVRYLKHELRDGWAEPSLLEDSVVHPDRIFPAHGSSEAGHPGLFWSLAFGVRAKTFDRLGGFNEAFTGYGAEDTDLAFRARDAGIPILLCADAVAFHQPHESLDPPLQHFADIMRNASLFRERHGVWPMQGWLNAFEEMGLIQRSADCGYSIVRVPTSQELDTARAR